MQHWTNFLTTGRVSFWRRVWTIWGPTPGRTPTEALNSRPRCSCQPRGFVQDSLTEAGVCAPERELTPDVLGSSPEGCENCFDLAFPSKVRVLAADNANDLSQDTTLARAVRDAFIKRRSTNILCETRFARIASQLWVSHKGRRTSLSSMSAKNMLAEMRHQHSQTCSHWNQMHGCPRDSGLELTPPQPTTSPKACSGWHLFFEDRRKTGGLRSAFSQSATSKRVSR